MKTVKILEGTLVGVALGVAAGVLLAPNSGKKTREYLKNLSGDFYNYITPKIKKLKKISEAEYNLLVAKGMKRYAKAKLLSLPEQKVILGEAKSFWEQIKRHIEA